MQVVLGYDSAPASRGNIVPVIWDSEKLINGHTLLIGKSGTGKTYTLREMIEQIASQAAKNNKKFLCHIMDVHGDIEISNSSTVKFSESTDYGFNPLVINPDPDFGGVRKRIEAFIRNINRSGRKLGDKQSATLRYLLSDLYEANGFYANDASSWKLNDPRRPNKKMPTLEDALKFANFKLKSMYIGSSSKATANLEKLNRKKNTLQGKIKKLNKAKTDIEITEMEAQVDKLADECILSYTDYIQSIKSGKELDEQFKYNFDTLKSVVERLDNLNSCGIFRNKVPPFERGKPIWRYDIKALSQEEKRIFVSFLLESIFYRATQRGVQDDIVELVILDEAHLFLTDDDDNPINVIAKEARKFGLGLIAASQSPTHFSDDFLSNVSTKILLGIDEMFWKGTASKLNVDLKGIEWIVPHKKILVQLNQKGQAKNNFIWTLKDKPKQKT